MTTTAATRSDGHVGFRRGAPAMSELLPTTGPGRRLATGTLIDTFGTGIFLAGGVVFLKRSVGLSAGRIGLALTIGGLLALFAGPVAGDLADRVGVRQVAVSTLMVEAAGSALLVLTHGFALLVLAVTLGEAGFQSGRSARGALIALLQGPENAVRLRAQLRSVANVGISLGTLVGGAALAIDTRTGYVAMILLDTATFLVTAAVYAGLPAFPPSRRIGDSLRRWVAVSDPPYLAVAALNAVLGVNYNVLVVGIPLWVTTRTHVPRPLVAALLLVNTLCVVILQVRASRGVCSPCRAALALRRSGVAFALGWTLVGLAAGLPAAAAAALLLAGVVLHTSGELWQAASSFELSFALAHPRAMGQYQGVFGIGEGVGDAFAPVIAATVCVAGGLGGWIGLGLALALVGATAPSVVAWATRSRAVEPAPLR